jgi:arylsulfatase A-like enzyme
MNPTRHLLGLLAGTAILSASPPVRSAQVNEANTPPNIIFFLVDDLGWTDINGTEGPDGQLYDNPGVEYDSRYYYTPNLAKLRNEGMRFTNAYAACPFCGPSRASILTGKYPARLGFTNNNTHDQNQGRGPFATSEMNFTEPIEPDLVRNLDPKKETSIARALKSNSGANSDYLSCAIGKWHVHREGVSSCGPEAHGFDFNNSGSYRGQPDGGNKPGWNFYRGNAWNNGYYPNLEEAYTSYSPEWPIGSDSNANNIDDNFEALSYLTDALTYRALEFIDLASRQSHPFFLYMSHYGVHSPMQAKRTDTNGDGILAADEPEVHADLFKGRWGSDERHEIDPPTGSGLFHTPFTYASMLKSIDESLGQIMNRLKTSGMAENTIVIFYSDNGGVERMGFTSNNPLRSEKTHGYEGGTRVPLIVWGPGIFSNGTCEVPVTGPDFFPTLLDLAGISLEAVESASPNNFSKEKLDGVSFVPLLKGDTSSFHRNNDPESSADDGAIFWHVPHYKHSAPYSAVIRDNHKYIRYWEDQENLQNRRETEDGYLMSEKELYDLTSNAGESADGELYDSDPTLARDLENILFKWLKSVDAKMPTAVKTEDQHGVTQEWYSQWISDHDPLKNYTDPIQEAINNAAPTDTITTYAGRFSETIDLYKIPAKVTIQSIDPGIHQHRGSGDH